MRARSVLGLDCSFRVSILLISDGVSSLGKYLGVMSPKIGLKTQALMQRVCGPQQYVPFPFPIRHCGQRGFYEFEEEGSTCASVGYSDASGLQFRSQYCQSKGVY